MWDNRGYFEYLWDTIKWPLVGILFFWVLFGVITGAWVGIPSTY